MRKMACEFNVRAGLTKKCHSKSREEMGRGGLLTLGILAVVLLWLCITAY